MKFSLISDSEREDEVVVYASEENELVKAIRALCEGENDKTLVGYDGSEIYKISYNDVICFVSENDRLYAYLSDVKLRIKSRLYQIEEELPPSFIRINQSCVANVSMIERFDASFSGTLGVVFKNGYRDYVSRRNLKKVKERVGLKK